MAIDLRNFGLANLLMKLPSVQKQVDARIERARKDAGTEKVSSELEEYLFKPLMSEVRAAMGSDKPMSQYEAANFSWKVYSTDGRIKAAIKEIVKKATQNNENKRPFEIDVKVESQREKDEIWQIIHDVFASRNVGVYKRAKTFARNALLEGDTYYRAIVDLALNRMVELRKIKGPRSGFVIERVKSSDQRLNGGYAQIERDSRRVVNYFFPGEVMRVTYDEDDELDKGTPIAMAAKKFCDREEKAAKAITLARWVRSWVRLFYKLEAKSSDDFVKQVKEIIKIQKQYGGDEAFSPVYSTGEVKPINEFSPALTNIRDIEYHQAAMFDTMETPRALYSSGAKDVPNRSVMDVLYDEWLTGTVTNVEEMLTGDESSGILSLVELQLNLIGKTSKFTPVGLIWPSKKKTSESEVKALELGFKAGDLSRTTFYAQLLNVDWETEMERRTQEEKLIAKMAKEREHILAKSGDNSKTIDDDSETDVDDDEEFPDIEELIGRKNGKSRMMEHAVHE